MQMYPRNEHYGKARSLQLWTAKKSYLFIDSTVKMVSERNSKASSELGQFNLRILKSRTFDSSRLRFIAFQFTVVLEYAAKRLMFS